MNAGIIGVWLIVETLVWFVGVAALGRRSRLCGWGRASAARSP